MGAGHGHPPAHLQRPTWQQSDGFYQSIGTGAANSRSLQTGQTRPLVTAGEEVEDLDERG